jgi:CDGSH-type Zn-finger protein
MSDPEIGGIRPVVLELDPDETYWWCACGKSRNQPWCDGSHAGTDHEPIEFSVEACKNYAMCTCKRTATSPFCDGAHSSLPKGGGGS